MDKNNAKGGVRPKELGLCVVGKCWDDVPALDYGLPSHLYSVYIHLLTTSVHQKHLIYEVIFTWSLYLDRRNTDTYWASYILDEPTQRELAVMSWCEKAVRLATHVALDSQSCTEEGSEKLSSGGRTANGKQGGAVPRIRLCRSSCGHVSILSFYRLYYQ